MAVFILLLLSSSVPVVATVSVTIINESNYPWLVAGAYADYIGESGGYVMPNGTLLLNVWAGSPTPSTSTTLDWTVLNRTGDMAWLQIQYHALGCDVSQEEYAAAAKSGFTNEPCTSFDFNTMQTLEVNVTSSEAYNGSQPIGLLNFWAPPLISSATAYGGTAFIDGVRQDVLSNITGPYTTSSTNCSKANPCSELGGPEGLINVNESGTSYTGPFTYYILMPANVGAGTNQTVGWFKINYPPTNGNGTPVNFYPEQSPQGFYNYYNGLALMFTEPEYPVQTWVCGDRGGNATNCEFTAYSTTLGTLFRSEGGFPVQLISTNIPIKPSQTSITQTITIQSSHSQTPTSQSSTSQSSTNQATSGFSLTTWEVVGVVSAVVVVSGFAISLRARRRKEKEP